MDIVVIASDSTLSRVTLGVFRRSLVVSLHTRTLRKNRGVEGPLGLKLKETL